jgi:periplasmic divalent cation tolerance protein
MTPRLVMVTAASLEEARAIAEALLQPRLAACVNIVPGVESHYWWRGKLERGSEVLLLVKTSAEQFEAVAAVVRAAHSYECPEIVALDPREMAPAYRAWWAGEIGARTRDDASEGRHNSV